MPISLLRKLVCCCALLLCFFASEGQQPAWLRSFGGFSDDQASAVAVDSATGSVYYGLYHFSSLTINSVGYTIVGQYDAMLIKVDSAGNVLWVKRLTTPGNDRVSSIAVGPNGDIAIAGVMGVSPTVNFFDSTISTSVACHYVARLSSSGQIKWFRTGGASPMTSISNFIAFEQNNIVTVGYTSFPSTFGIYPISTNYYIASFDTSGRINWFHNPPNAITALDVRPNQIFIAGQFFGSITLGPLVLNSTTNLDGYWAKLDGNGNYTYLKKIYSTKTDNISLIKADPSGGVFIGGTTTGDTIFCDTKALFYSPTTANTQKSFITYFDRQGNYRWIQKMQILGPGIYNTLLKSGSLTAKGSNLFIGGSLTKPASAATFNFGGNLKSFADGAPNKMFVCKLDTEGTFLWTYASGNSSGIINNALVATDKNKSVYYASGTSGVSVFTPFSVTPIGLYDGVLLKINDASISRTPISKISYCGGDSMYIPFNSYGIFGPSNTFYAQLSDTAGNFNGPAVTLGQLKTDSNGVIAFALPQILLPSSKYRIRIMSDVPVIYSDLLNQQYSIASTPSVNAGSDQTICSGQSGALIATQTGGTIYRWNPGNLVTDSTALNTTFISKINTLPADKPYPMRLVVRNSFACADTDTVVISVRQQLSMKAASDTTLCLGNGTCIVMKPTGGRASSYVFKWFDKNNVVLSYDDSLCLNATDTGFYRATLTDQCSNSAPFQMVHVHRFSPLSVVLTKPPLTVCKDDKLTFKAKAGGGNGRYIFQWYDIADSTVVLGTDSIFKIQVTNPISIRCKVTDGCTALPVWSEQVDIIFKPLLDIAIGSNLTLPAGVAYKIPAQITPTPTRAHKVSWYWRGQYYGFGDSTNLVPDSSGTLQAILYDSCMKAFDTASIYVTVRLHLKILYAADTTICTSGSASFTLGAIAPDISKVVFTWDNSLGTGNSKTVTPSATTVYTVIITDGFNLADTAKIKVTLLPPLQITNLYDTTVCDGKTAVITANATGGSKTYSFSWSDGFLGAVRSIPSPDSNITYTVTVTDGCSPPAAKSIKVSKEALPVLNLVASPLQSCPPLVATLRNTAINNPAFSYQYYWEFGDGQLEMSTADSSVHSFPKSGIYQVYVTMKSPLGCSNRSAPVTLIVNPKPSVAFETNPDQAPVTNPEINFTPDCSNADSLRWYFGDGDSSFIFSAITHTYPDTGRYKVKLIAQNALGCKDSVEGTVRILPDYAAWIPTAFTPGPDSLNSTFHPYGIGIRDYTMVIYNRWGQLVFKNTGKTDEWNGGIENDVHRPADEGLYVYYIGLRNYHGRGYSYKGTVYLIRH